MKKIIIKNFGPFIDLDFTIEKQLNIFIGEQAAGKSTLAKVIYFFRDIPDCFPMVSFAAYMQRNFDKSNIKTLFFKYLEDNFINSFSDTLLTKESYLQYYYNNNSYIELKIDKHKNINFVFSKEILIKLENIITEWNEILSIVNDRNKVFQVINSYEAKIKEIFDEDADTLYIPAARSIISTIALENSYDLLKNDKFDYTVKNFISAMDAFKKLRWSNNPLKTLKIYLDNYDISKFNNEIKIKKYENIVQDILKGHYLLEKDKEFIIINNQKIEFQFASSGQQEVLWILNFLILSIINERKFFFVIEEPEAHLFTQTQLDVTKFIAMTANLTNSEIFITTHSPYILNAVNLLMYSGKVEKESINANSIIDILYRIDPKKVGAFYIKGGKLIDIIDPDEMLIQSEKIDEVAGGINLLFDKLISLELNKQNGENNGL